MGYIPILFFAYVLFWGPISVGAEGSFLGMFTRLLAVLNGDDRTPY